MIYELHPEGALEHLEQIAYYEDKSPGFGARYHPRDLSESTSHFLREVQQCSYSLITFPGGSY